MPEEDEEEPMDDGGEDEIRTRAIYLPGQQDTYYRGRAESHPESQGPVLLILHEGQGCYNVFSDETLSREQDCHVTGDHSLWQVASAQDQDDESHARGPRR